MLTELSNILCRILQESSFFFLFNIPKLNTNPSKNYKRQTYEEPMRKIYLFKYAKVRPSEVLLCKVLFQWKDFAEVFKMF